MTTRTTKDLIVVTPSRSRPHNVERLWEAMSKTCRADTELVIGLDKSDPLLDSYPAGPQYVARSGLERRVVEWINILSAPRLGVTQAVGHFGDDCLPKTDGWDEMILEALGKRPLAYGNDMSIERPPGALATHVFMRSETCQALGYFGPPSIQHMWVDLTWMEWGAAAGMTYLDHCVIEHLHFLEQKAKVDASYVLSRQLVDRDLIALYEYVRDGLNEDLQKIAPGTPFITVRDFVLRCNQRGTPIPVPPGFASLV